MGAETPEQDVAALMRQVLYEIKKVVVGQDHFLERLLVAILSRGHLLVEGVPGLAKTLTVNTLAKTIQGSFKRIQFTPDLVPADLVGTRIYNQREGAFSTSLGPVFCNLLLADEINRAPAKVQSALLEVMAERQVSLAGKTHPLPRPFVVIATENPIESEGVYPLPEAQRDRFLMKVSVSYPSATEEMQILQRMSVDPPVATRILDPGSLIALQKASDEIAVHELVADYIVRLVMATREPEQYRLADLKGVIDIGASPRATLGLVASARALALLRGRDYVLPDDVKELFIACCAHRVISKTYLSNGDADATTRILKALLEQTPAPK